MLQMQEAPLLRLERVTKAFPSSRRGQAPVLAVADFNLELREGELLVLFGPNGCGKTTILNILAGLCKPDSGTVERFHHTDDFSIGYVFQNHVDTLLPWRTVKSNVAMPLELRHLDPKTLEARVKHRLSQFHLEEHSDKFIYELSGGLKQLTAIARAAVYDPKLLLLDEPFSALDYSLSRGIWMQFREFWSSEEVTTVFVSHSVDEAVFLADRVLVLSERPATRVREIQVTFGRKRPLSLLSSEDFFAVRTQVIQAFDEGRQ